MQISSRGAVLVTGSSTGIGRACALELERAGFSVFAAVRKPEDGEALQAAGGSRIKPLILDVTDAATITAAVERIGELTSGRLAGLVNNAGVAVPGPVETIPIDDFRRQFEVNVIGQVAVTQACLAMIRAARGRVVLISSIGGRVALPYVFAYSSSKHALEGIGDSLRQEMKRFGVEVSIIEPGAVATPIWTKGQQEAPAIRAAMDPPMRELYGDQLDALRRASEKADAGGVPPEQVAATVLEALTAKRPRTRYPVGTDAKVQSRLRRLLPDRVFDRLIARELGL